jgi:hypothetical protein
MSDTVLSSLPTISGNGLFTVSHVVPTASGGLFEPMANNDSTSYSYPLMDPAKLIGTAGQPYMNVSLPAYITTLYANTYKINDNLKNSISTAAVDNREYPTSYAVQQYVQSQVSGTQIINGSTLENGNGNTYTVNTTTVNTIITTANSAAAGFTYTYNGDPASIAVYWMDTSANTPRNGASKTVMYSASNYLRDASGNITGDLAFLYAGNSSNFVHMGVNYKYYQFVIRGDFLDFIQSYNSSTSSWEWIVKDSLGVFSNTVSVDSAISDANADMPTPASGITVS